VTFLTKLNKKKIYLKMAHRLDLINLIVCLIGDVPTPLNCCNQQVTVRKLLQGK
jgi:hypothetical protein